jgi:glycosyltransferase involved in cell wall biosynthesis
VKRLAFLSPLPPAPTGIADYCVEVATLLAVRYAIDLFSDQTDVDRARIPAGCAVYAATTFLDRHRERPYDLALYQMGNAPAHAFLYDLLPRVPGLMVLHDLVLHHSRARTFLDSENARAYAAEPWSATRRQAAEADVARYRAELEYCYPKQAERLVPVHLETTGTLLPYAYPLYCLPVEASRLSAVHNGFMLDAVRNEVPGARVVRIPHQAPMVAVAEETLAALRARHGLSADDFVVGVFGLLTREKRVETVARAVARAARHLQRVKLLLVGAVPEGEPLKPLLMQLGVRDRTIVTGRVAWEELPAYMTLPDVAVQLRYPSARETSGALLRLLAQGRPTVISDLAHQSEIPDDAVVRADVTDEEGEVTRAIERLAASPAKRERLGQNARAFIEREHAPARTRAAYVDAIEEAVRLPDPPQRAWPAHWPRSGERLTELL